MPLILVVDDEPGARVLLRRALLQAGHKVHLASNGIEALEEVHRTTFDLVMLDLIMPKQDGLETIQLLKREFPLLKVIAMCGALNRSSPELMLEIARFLGATASLPKPFSALEALKTVQTVLES
jgi:CheY-like chemotaxis protein